jgi:ubiquinone/menaquinone biosynthesis C-methylase UbiE
LPTRLENRQDGSREGATNAKKPGNIFAYFAVLCEKTFVDNLRALDTTPDWAIIVVWRLRGMLRMKQERVAGHEGLDDPEVASAFDRIAAMPQMRLLRRFVARSARRMQPHGQAVDLGCGPGHLVVELARMAPGLHVTGVDLSDEMLARAEACARQSGLQERISFRKGDAAQIPFPDRSLDLAVSTLSLHHWSEPVAVLDEIERVLRPGGAFLVFDLRRDVAAPLYLLLWFVTHCVVPPALRRVDEPLGSRNAAYTPHEAAKLARQSRLSRWQVTSGPLWLTIESKEEMLC